MSLPGETNPILLLGLVVVLILIAVGIFVLVLVYWQRGQSKTQSAQRSSESTVRPTSTTGSAPAEGLEQGKSQLSPDSGPESDLAYRPAYPGEVMRVIRDEKTGRIIVDMDGQQYTHLREIKDAQAGRRVLWAIADLVRFTGGVATNPQAVRTVTSTADEGSPETIAAAPPLAPLPVETTAASSLAPLPIETVAAPATPSVSGQRYSMVNFFRRGFQPDVPVVGTPSSSFIDEIEDILQARINARSTPLAQDVHVKTGEGGKLKITVGLNVYSSPEEVPDPEIQELIKAAVADWEKS